MKKNASSEFGNDEFGRDLGLMHEIVIAGRRFGADRQFWINC